MSAACVSTVLIAAEPAAMACQGSRNNQNMRRRVIGTAALVGGAIGLACFWRRNRQREIDRLAAILGWQPGSSFADVGAGSGRLSIEAARRIGPAGRVIATDIDPKKLSRIRTSAAKHGLNNITVVQAGNGLTGLPAGSCDSALLRGSYHHFADPGDLTADLYRALRPGGVICVVDFPPRRWLTVIAPVKGVPPDRGGHGIPLQVVTREMTAAGFEVTEVIPRWFLDVYCAVFRKPAIRSEAE